MRFVERKMTDALMTDALMTDAVPQPVNANPNVVHQGGTQGWYLSPDIAIGA